MSSSLERSSLSALLPFFSAVTEGDGTLSPDHFWGKLVKEQNASYVLLDETPVFATFVNARRIQKVSTGMLRALQILTGSLAEMCAPFKEHIDSAALRRGLEDLPDEILSLILGSVTSLFTEALGLSHVCSRFRQVMLGSPHVWANCKLNMCMNPRQVGALVDRSRNFPLKVSIPLICRDRARCVEYVFSLKDQLEDLEFQWVTEYENEHILKHYLEIQMPRLRKLAVNRMCWPADALHFYASWCLPSLKCLEFTDVIPKPVFGQKLSHCHMKFSDCFQPETLKLFLQSLTSLKALEISLVNVEDDKYYEDEIDDDDDSPRISNIASFSFSIIGKTSFPFARCVLETTRPNVTEMSFTIVYRHDAYDFQVYSERTYILESMRRFSMLKNLHLRFSGPNADYDLDFSRILHSLPRSLENLRIEAPGHIFWMPDCGYTVPQFRTLHFLNCDRMDLEFLEAARDDFLLNNVVIRKIEVAGCRLVDEDILRGAFPNSEVVWKL
ncbi:hypothetical protein DFH11DRAFT_1237631 [Phellopilus nigrolimitatus]|nr:hypothetical protein DFH11DRAFT_1237631 [Phellopilus nigrolimitatus]